MSNRFKKFRAYNCINELNIDLCCFFPCIFIKSGDGNIGLLIKMRVYLLFDKSGRIFR